MPHTSRQSGDVICTEGILRLDRSTCRGKERGTFLPSVRAAVNEYGSKKEAAAAQVLWAFAGGGAGAQKNQFDPSFLHMQLYFSFFKGKLDVLSS